MYLWLKAFHIIFMVTWFAGLFYLPRLFVYHCDAPAGTRQSETFKIMERRLMKAIINPAMIASWIFGVIAVVAALYGLYSARRAKLNHDFPVKPIWAELTIAGIVGLHSLFKMSGPLR